MLALPRFFFFLGNVLLQLGRLVLQSCRGSSGVCPLHGLHFSAAGCSGFLYAMRPAKGMCVRQSWGSRVARQGASSFHSPQTNWPFWPFSLASIPGLYAQHCLFLLSHSTSLHLSCRNVHPGK